MKPNAYITNGPCDYVGCSRAATLVAYSRVTPELVLHACADCAPAWLRAGDYPDTWSPTPTAPSDDMRRAALARITRQR